jgi:hypothetical protein
LTVKEISKNKKNNKFLKMFLINIINDIRNFFFLFNFELKIILLNFKDNKKIILGKLKKQ